MVSFEEYFPLQIRLINNQFVVINPMINEDKVEKRDVIESINNIPTHKILQDIYAHIPSQAHIKNGKKGMFNAFQDIYIPYALNFPKTYKIQIEGKTKAIILKPISEKPKYLPLISPKSPCQKQYCFNKLNDNTALLTLRSFNFYGDKTKLFKEFLDNSFKTLRKENYQNLIIDIRNNLGGTSAIGRHLLKHTLKEPFKFFLKSDFEVPKMEKPFSKSYKGKIVVLINGDGFSSVGQLASIYKDKNRVTFIGETLGSNQFCAANQKQFELTNTKFKFTVARNIFITAVQEKDSKTIIEPDINIEQSIEDFLADKDVVLEKATEFVKN